jgi:glycosyltransferase involved in cell wall biosynthesis
VKSTRSHERVCLLTGGGFPYRRDALSGWCRTLVEGLRRFRFDLLTVTDREPPSGPAYPLPRNVGSASAVQIGRELPRERRRGDHNEAGRGAAHLLCRGLLEDRQFAAGLRGLAELAAERADPLAGVPLADLLVDAWKAQPESADPPLPRLSARDARTGATLLKHALGALTVVLPETELVHCVGGTTPLLAALAGGWRAGVPLLLTEARAPVARYKPAEDRLSPAVRAVLRRFRAAVARTGYAEAGLIAPLSAYHHGWALRHGAEATRLVQVPAGVDPSEYPLTAEPNTEPAVVWAGSGGPDSGITPLLAAFEQVSAAQPGTVLHLVGVTPAHEQHCAELIERTGLGRAVRLHPLPADPRDRYTVGHVVAHVPGPADPPYRLIEAMMSGRAVVGVDVGPAAETLGDAGVLVQSGDPAELAIAIVGLLRKPHLRRQLGDAARERAMLHFTTDRVVRVYDALYHDLAASPPPAAFELTLAVPAPRSGLPATVRWLTGADRPGSSSTPATPGAPTPGGPTTDDPTPDDVTPDERGTTDLTAGDPSTDHPTLSDPTPGDPTPGDPTPGDPRTDEPATHGPTPSDLGPDDLTPDDPRTDDPRTDDPRPDGPRRDARRAGPVLARPPVSQIASAAPISPGILPPRPASPGVAPGEWPIRAKGGVAR